MSADIKISVRYQTITAVSCEVTPCALVDMCTTLTEKQIYFLFRVKFGGSMFLRHYLTKPLCIFDVRGPVHHSIIHIETVKKMQQCTKIYYFMFICCWTLWLLDAVSVQQPQRPTTLHVCKSRGC